ncbi:MAG TPA: L-glutamate gamma-semialdehyde dehydrogenase [Gemmatimonadales bacterium]|nr:L-glutamate gamma-semialdehyde dehydrogenase [Gemmatimonadales bacterium]
MSVSSNIPLPKNEPILGYFPGSAERAALKTALGRVGAETIDIPVVIGGREIHTGRTENVTSPHCHQRVLARVHQADRTLVGQAVDAALEAQRDWAHWRFEDRAAVFLKAAELLATSRRQLINAATMHGQSKTVFQAEIDAACELIDFLRYNVHFAERIYREQPESSPGIWNRLDYRPLEGFVYAVTPFNFTAIGGNLAAAPALMGNVVVWKPAPTASLSNWYVFKLFEEAGLPPGVINFVPGDPIEISDVLLSHRMLAGIHFTGSTAVFQKLWQQAASNLSRYAGYPRIVGETGGKDFVVAHESADLDGVVTALIRGGFEYQGQKCSAASRGYIPDSIWPAVRDRLVAAIGEIRVGDVADFRNFMGAVIDRKSFAKIKDYVDHAKQAAGVKLLAGGGADATVGWFVQPTLFEVEDPSYRLLCEEIFGPVLGIHVYPAKRWRETLELVDRTGPYALTGAVWARDRAALVEADRALRNAAGNYYVNDKPTGAVVGQQPFGGARASGTNDKAGSILNLLRWVSPRTIKETLAPPSDWRYHYMSEP